VEPARVALAGGRDVVERRVRGGGSGGHPLDDRSRNLDARRPVCESVETGASPREYGAGMKGDRVEIVVDTGQGGTQTFEITASKNGRRLEVTTARGVVEVSEVTRGGTPVRTGRFMASRLIALVEHPAQEQPDSRVEVETRRRLRPPDGG
jgi:hypothetical protein